MCKLGHQACRHFSAADCLTPRKPTLVTPAYVRIVTLVALVALVTLISPTPTLISLASLIDISGFRDGGICGFISGGGYRGPDRPCHPCTWGPPR